MTASEATLLGYTHDELKRFFPGALAQIDRNEYAAKFDLTGRKVVKIGVSFSSEKRTITDVKIG